MLITWWYLYLAARSIAEKCKYCCCFCVCLRVFSRWTLQEDNVWDGAQTVCCLFFLVMDLDVREVTLPLVLLRQLSGLICNPSALRIYLAVSWMQYLWSLSTQLTFWMFPSVVSVYSVCFLTRNALLFSPSCPSSILPSSALRMASILQKLLTPLFSGPPEPPRNKVTVVGVGQVGMACAVSILLRVRAPLVLPLFRLPFGLLVSQDGVIPRILLEWHRITDLLVSDLAAVPSLSLLKCGDNDGKI